MDKKSEEQQLSPLQAWMTAVRARTLPIPTIQVAVGCSLAYAFMGTLDWMLALFTWLVAVFITFGTNLINDVYDYERGGDLPERAGHQKMITAGLISKREMFAAGMALLGLAILCSIPLALQAGWGIFFLVVVSAVVGFCYTGGPYPICYLGFSEIFILCFYGFVCVGAAYYIQTGDLSTPAFVSALQMGMLAILPNALNNFRDTIDDAKVNKLTLAVRFGETFARNEIVVLSVLPFLLNLYWLTIGYREAAFLPFLVVPLAYYFVYGVRNTPPGPRLRPYFPLSVAFHFGFGLLLSIGFILRS